ncbi:hypothetical protein TNCV_974231 [Trichonephila clavipes]|nr:hypothetical protein TNCV_974231 [Trichonephila clavipes]
MVTNVSQDIGSEQESPELYCNSDKEDKLKDLSHTAVFECVHCKANQESFHLTYCLSQSKQHKDGFPLTTHVQGPSSKRN